MPGGKPLFTAWNGRDRGGFYSLQAVEPQSAPKARCLLRIVRGLSLALGVTSGAWCCSVGRAAESCSTIPAVGPYRVWSERSWSLPGVAAPAEAMRTAPLAEPQPSSCQSLIDAGVALGRGADPEAAMPALNAAVALCPDEARPLRELAGVRFRQERWAEAAAYAARASLRAPADLDGSRLLGASRFLADERDDALLAWNHADEPRVDRIRIEGLSRTGQQVVLGFLGLEARELLTPEALALATRRLAELPSASSTAIAYRPAALGRAGTGTGRPWLLRAYPLLRDGVVTGEAFGRGLLHASIELESPPLPLRLVRLGFAFFSDWARAFDAPDRRAGTTVAFSLFGTSNRKGAAECQRSEISFCSHRPCSPRECCWADAPFMGARSSMFRTARQR
jgi:hypothetical protein